MTNEEAIKELQSMCDHLHAHGICDKDSNMLTACKKAISALEQLPSVTRQTGEWILLDECANSGYYCSRCQKKLVKEGWSDTVKKIKFCPNCGAKMESEDKE